MVNVITSDALSSLDETDIKTVFQAFEASARAPELDEEEKIVSLTPRDVSVMKKGTIRSKGTILDITVSQGMAIRLLNGAKTTLPLTQFQDSLRQTFGGNASLSVDGLRGGQWPSLLPESAAFYKSVEEAGHVSEALESSEKDRLASDSDAGPVDRVVPGIG